MEIDLLVGGEPHIAVDGDNVGVAVILKEEAGLGVSHQAPGVQGAWATREMAELHALPKFCSWGGGRGRGQGSRRGGGWGDTRAAAARRWLEGKVRMAEPMLVEAVRSRVYSRSRTLVRREGAYKCHHHTE